MESRSFATLLLLCQLLVVYNIVQGRIQSFSTEEEFELEKQLKKFNKPAIKMIRTQYGDAYDCVDFHKQTPAGHPLVKNTTSTIYFQADTTALHKKLKGRMIVEVNLGFENEECPGGTIPIRRITKKDVARQRFLHKRGALANDNPNGVNDYAVCRTKDGSKKFKGITAKVAIYNPTVKSQQFSAARLKLQNGPDSIEAGWRVDPVLYGDNLTRLYIHTDAGESHCFNTQCPGFMVTSTKIPLDTVLDEVSVIGGDAYVLAISIVQDTEGNWVLIIGSKNTQVGYWPKTVFSNTGQTNYAEWGGEAFSPDSMTKPRMGSGQNLVEDTNQDAFFQKVKVIDESGKAVDPNELDCLSDRKFYKVKDEGIVNDHFEHLIFYGGPGGLKLSRVYHLD